MEIENPFPITGSIRPTDYGYGASLSAPSEYITEVEGPNLLQAAVDRSARKYGEDVRVEVVFYGDEWDGATDYELLGPIDDD